MKGPACGSLNQMLTPFPCTCNVQTDVHRQSRKGHISHSQPSNCLQTVVPSAKSAALTRRQRRPSVTLVVPSAKARLALVRLHLLCISTYLSSALVAQGIQASAALQRMSTRACGTAADKVDDEQRLSRMQLVVVQRSHAATPSRTPASAQSRGPPVSPIKRLRPHPVNVRFHSLYSRGTTV